jgi:succinate dehydrogenase / fumarate reductase cytochrome b subunit
VGIEKLASLVQHPFNNFHVAHFLGTSFCQTRNFTDTTLMGKLLSMLQAKKVNFASVYESNGFEVFECSELLAKQLASTAMLDMFDNAADFVLIDDARSFIMFDFRIIFRVMIIS